MYALIKELMLPYIRAEMVKEEPVITTQGFLKYVMNQKDDHTYGFLSDAVIQIMDAILMYRKCVRDAIPSFMMAGRGLFAKVWSGRNHPLYRELEMSDSVVLLVCQVN